MGTLISAFSADQVCRITGLTTRQLSYWDKSGFFKPAHQTLDGEADPLKVYSFNDVVGLRVIAVLRKDHKLSIQGLRKAAEELRRYADRPWSSLQLVVCKGEVGIHDSTSGRARGIFTGQYVMVPIIDQIRHVQRAVDDLSRRRPEQVGAAERHRNVAHNARVFAGTRVPIRAVERFLDAGFSIDAILQEYPSLQREDVALVERERNKLDAA